MNMNPNQVLQEVSDLFDDADELRRLERTGTVLEGYVKNLLRLAHTTGDRRYRRMAEEARNDFAVIVNRAMTLADRLVEAGVDVI